MLSILATPLRRFLVRLGFLAAGALLAQSRAAAAPGDIYVSNYLEQTVSIVTSENAALFVHQASAAGSPDALAFDSSGNLYVADAPSRIMRYAPNGAGSVFADASSGLYFPSALAFDSTGDLYVADSQNNNILRFTPAGAVSVFANSGAGLSDPLGLAFDASDNLYVANLGFQNILRITPAGVSTVFAATGASGLSLPEGVAFDSAGRLYVVNDADGTPGNILRFTPEGVGSVFAAKGLDAPESLAINAAGDVYVTNEQGFVESFTPDGSPSTFYQSSGGYPWGIAIEPAVKTTTKIPVLSVIAKGSAIAIEDDLNGTFVIARSTADAKALPVRFSLLGTAKNGVEYQKIASPAVIPAGAASVKIKIVPIGKLAETGLHTVMLKLLASPDGAYTLSTEKKATITIESRK